MLTLLFNQAASGSITPDGSGTGSSGSGTLIATISTTQTNDIIVAVIACNSGSAHSVTSTSGLTWTQLDVLSDGSLEIWWALAASPVTNEVVTVSTNIAYAAMVLMAFKGCNTSTPWNTGAALGKNTGHPSDPVSGTTTVANTMLIGAHRFSGTGSPTAGNGWTGVSSPSLFLLGEYEVGATAGSYSSTLTVGASDANGSMIAALISLDAPIALMPQICI